MKTVLALVFSGMAAVSGAMADENRVGIVTFTVDNLTSRFFDNSMPTFFEHNVPGTLFGQTEPMNGDPHEMYWDDVAILLANGWEFGAHSYTHDFRLSEVGDYMLELELGAPAAYIYRGSGVYPTSFATPFGDYNRHVLDRARIYYDAHFCAWGNDGINEFDSTDHFRINRVSIEAIDTTEGICTDIETAGREGYWLVYMLHRVDQGNPGEYELTAELFEGIVECAAELRDAGIVRLMTGKEALEHVPHTPRHPR